MGSLSYTATISLDGYAADTNGDFQWSALTDEVFQFHVERMAAVSTEVLGPNTYLLMRYWETEPEAGDWGALEHEFARRWRDIDQVVASSTLTQNELASERVRVVPALGLSELKRALKCSGRPAADWLLHGVYRAQMWPTSTSNIVDE